MEGRRVNITATVLIGSQPVRKRHWNQLDVMKIGQVRAWVRKTFNCILKKAERDQQVTASFYGQMLRAPFTVYSGELGGVNKVTLRTKGMI